MDVNKELNYRLYIQMQDEFVRTDLKSEFSKYDDIKNGDVDKVLKNIEEIKKNYYSGKGKLSDSLLRNNQYHFAIGTGIIARVCVDGGLEHEVAYTLSDIYIRQADKCTRPEEIIELTGVMMLDFTKRMSEIRKPADISLHVRRTIDYIYSNLHLPLTLEMAAKHEDLDPSYLSKLFSGEMHISIKAFILKAKISTAKNILAYSDHSISEITNSLCFSSQSAFTAAFKKETGMTPQKYRNHFGETSGLVE